MIAVDNISFDLNRGEIVGLLGSNGAGKSTTMKIITGSLQADSGTVDIFGYNITEKPVQAKSHIGYLSEDNPLPSDMYVHEYLQYIVGMYKLKNLKNIVDSTIEKFGLTNEYKKKIHTLSKGNRQKLGLAQSMIHNPDLLILDEPTNGLDPNQQAEIQEMIKNFGNSKIILLSTHILHEIENIASRIIIIEKGRIVTNEKTENISSVEELYHNIQK